MGAPPSPAALRAHELAQTMGRPTYIDPVSGYTVITANALLARGACCGNGCRHCPYPPEEQRRAGRPGAR